MLQARRHTGNGRALVGRAFCFVTQFIRTRLHVYERGPKGGHASTHAPVFLRWALFVLVFQAFTPRLALPGRSNKGMVAFREAVVAVTGDKVGNGDVISFEVGANGSIVVHATMGGAAVKSSPVPFVDKVPVEAAFNRTRTPIAKSSRPFP